MTNNMANDFLNMWELMVDEFGICTNEEIGLAIALCGRSVQTLESILYIRTGYRSLEQMFDECLEEIS